MLTPRPEFMPYLLFFLFLSLNSVSGQESKLLRSYGSAAHNSTLARVDPDFVLAQRALELTARESYYDDDG